MSLFIRKTTAVHSRKIEGTYNGDVSNFLQQSIVILNSHIEELQTHFKTIIREREEMNRLIQQYLEHITKAKGFLEQAKESLNTDEKKAREFIQQSDNEIKAAHLLTLEIIPEIEAVLKREGETMHEEEKEILKQYLPKR